MNITWDDVISSHGNMSHAPCPTPQHLPCLLEMKSIFLLLGVRCFAKLEHVLAFDVLSSLVLIFEMPR